MISPSLHGAQLRRRRIVSQIPLFCTNSNYSRRYFRGRTFRAPDSPFVQELFPRNFLIIKASAEPLQALAKGSFMQVLDSIVRAGETAIARPDFDVMDRNTDP